MNEEDAKFIRERLDYARKYKLDVELIYSALEIMKNQPDLSIREVLVRAEIEWDL